MSFIEIKATDIPNLIKGVYALSVPVGMGYMHYQEGDLPEPTLGLLMERLEKNLQRITKLEADGITYGLASCVMPMDYIHGRCCKFGVFYNSGKFFIDGNWFDHSEAQLDMLLTICNIARENV